MTGPDDLIRRGDVLRIFEPETSMVRRRICDDVRAIPSVSIAAPSEVHAEREACAVLASVRADSLDDAIKWGGGKVYLASLKGGLIELRNLAAAIRKRGESEG